MRRSKLPLLIRRRVPVRTGLMPHRWIGHKGWFSIPLGRLSGLLIITRMADHILSHDRTLPLDSYSTKKLIRSLGLPVDKIDACKNGCILYWKDDIDLDYCKFSGETRYKLTRERNPIRKKAPYAILRYLQLAPRPAKVVYASKATAKQMTWHANHQTEEKSMCHPSDAEAWRHFDQTYPNFAVEPRNVRLDLCTDRFAPHGQYGRTYSCWPIILTSYNLLPRMCMSFDYVLLTIGIRDPSNLKRPIDVYMELLIEELQSL
ncbi:UNVERIFIED_CONTAM: hypothetical protein Scaly_2213200 [Sesamum calycinum]|uniref:Uncharacterized protein n=1 Tax=Sesamum calycinum TaxID=2727403 RepID=A0AAW2J628_9LAMI